MEKIEKKRFGDRVKDRRMAAHLSQEYVAEVMGYKTRSSIQKIEAGKADIPRAKIIALAEVLKTTPAYLMGSTDDPRDFGTQQEAFIDEDLPLDDEGRVDRMRIQEDYYRLMLADPSIYKLILDLSDMSLYHRDIIYKTAADFAEMDRQTINKTE